MENREKTMYELIMEEVKNNPILTEEEAQPMSLEEMFDEEDFLEEIAIIDRIAEQYSEEKDKSKVKALIDEALEKRRLLHEMLEEVKRNPILTESERKQVNLFMEEFKQSGGMSTEELIQKLNAVPLEEFINDLREEIRNYPNDNI